MAHVLFMDIVAYSKLPMERQSEILAELQQTVRNTNEFGQAKRSRQLLTLPTGDGMALVFFGDVEAPARCALKVGHIVNEHPYLKLRMGINTGPVQRVEDINANRNVAGGGINIAQRVMDCGDSGHILVSKSTADMLSEISIWRGALHDLGEVEVKHGIKLHLYNLLTDEAGNRELPEKLLGARRRKTLTHAKRWSVGLTAVGALAAGLLITLFYRGTAHALRPRDTIVLADFTNRTGDTVFNDALKQGLAVELDQSPFLNILDDRKVSEQLRYMGRSANEPLTSDLAREVCLRAGSQAMLLGSIWGMGSQYVIGLKAVECRDGNILGEVQVEADHREDVLGKLHGAGTSIRKKLGESLASIQKFDVPLQQATTPSLEALQSYSRATKTWQLEGELPAVPLYQHAIELDPSFAAAYADLAVIYATLNEFALSAQNAQKAYDLRAKVTERERFVIDSTYYLYATGEQEKAAQVFEQWKEVYPQDLAPYVNTGLVDTALGRLEQALESDQAGLKLNQQNAMFYGNLAYDYVYLNKLEEAKAILDQARGKNLNDSLLLISYQLAFLRDDVKEMQRCVTSGAAKPGYEDALLSSQSDTEAFHGRLRVARTLSRRAIESALSTDAKEVAAGWQVGAALREAEFGNSEHAIEQAIAALALGSNREVEIGAALAFARAGDTKRAETLAAKLEKSFPANTLLKGYWLPTIRGAVALRKNNPAQAIKVLEWASVYQLGGAPPPFSSGATLYPAYVRGQAYLATKRWSEAANEFQKLIEHRGLVWNFPLGALTQLQLARAYAASGDPRARATYQGVLALWRDADPEVPVFREAKAEYSKLK